MTTSVTILNHGFKNDVHKRHFEPILDQWVAMIQRFADQMPDGIPPFGFGERPTLGLLAAAAWRSNFIALEEIPIDKVDDARQYPGRADLGILCEKTIYVIEAKNVTGVWNEARFEQEVDRAIAEATQNIRSHGEYVGLDAYDVVRLAVVFAAPHILPEPNGRLGRTGNNQWLDRYVQSLPASQSVDFWAQVFPFWNDQNVYDDGKGGKVGCPGVILVAKEVPLKR